MKKLILLIITSAVLVSCSVNRENAYTTEYADNEITESLFKDESAKITEDNIKRLLDGHYSLPKELRVAIISIENTKANRYYYYNQNDYLTSRQKYIDCLKENLDNNTRIKATLWIPNMMTGANPSFSTIREAAVRMQADIVLVYSISEGNIYTKHKVFSSNHKAFATTQAMIMDVRTGLIPHTDISTKEFLGVKEEKDKKAFNNDEKRKLLQEEAVLLTLKDINESINKFLNQ
ncbi:hypothetical protein D0T53_00220 [Dysgonomonas sp. 216]|uniref:hypothetical protein n=1 Tax=Dysgonomonas sp. 216 TaxID=2302934 RepID=UPI0013D53F82|nr:hypothetical protein [Dysgonomonas sp. 216]NDW17338.1 hypothetical protein [Dysgonomonas sp. 216]